jgi:hypothetical protein
MTSKVITSTEEAFVPIQKILLAWKGTDLDMIFVENAEKSKKSKHLIIQYCTVYISIRIENYGLIFWQITAYCC